MKILILCIFTFIAVNLLSEPVISAPSKRAALEVKIVMGEKSTTFSLYEQKMNSYRIETKSSAIDRSPKKVSAKTFDYFENKAKLLLKHSNGSNKNCQRDFIELRRVELSKVVTSCIGAKTQQAKALTELANNLELISKIKN